MVIAFIKAGYKSGYNSDYNNNAGNQSSFHAEGKISEARYLNFTFYTVVFNGKGQVYPLINNSNIAQTIEKFYRIKNAI